MNVSTFFVLVLLGWVAVHRWRPRWGWLKRGLLALAVPPALLIYPFTNNLMAGWLEFEFDPDRPCLGEPPAAIVVLAAGVRRQPPGIGAFSRLSPTSVVRILEGVSLARRHPEAWLIFAGHRSEAAMFQRGLAALGPIGRDRVLIDDQASSTDRAARGVAALLAARGLDSAWLVTSALHVPRALLAFRHNGVATCPYPVDYTAQPNARPWWIFPPPQGLERADKLAHEALGLAWYWATGKI